MFTRMYFVLTFKIHMHAFLFFAFLISLSTFFESSVEVVQENNRFRTMEETNSTRIIFQSTLKNNE